jgi:hypothetical protein
MGEQNTGCAHFTQLLPIVIERKYQCAVERKIPILKPSWIIDTFELWQRGDDFDFDTVGSSLYFLPPLR